MMKKKKKEATGKTTSPALPRPLCALNRFQASLSNNHTPLSHKTVNLTPDPGHLKTPTQTFSPIGAFDSPCIGTTQMSLHNSPCGIDITSSGDLKDETLHFLADENFPSFIIE